MDIENMPCYHPIKACITGVRANGKKQLSFKQQDIRQIQYEQIQVPCGRCTGCRLEYSRQWAIRITHEASLYEENSFITLTYNKEHLPDDHSIHKETMQKFIKRLRKEIDKKYSGKKIRYYLCGEYGELRNRPHYHAIIFNFGFPDKTLWTIRDDIPLYRSKLLEKIWTDPVTNKSLGYSSIGEVTFESAAYVARYALKKLNGEKAKSEYQILDKETGEIHQINPEFALMSRGGKYGRGIGYKWYENYSEDTDKDFLYINRKRVKIPKYYDSLRERVDPESLMNIKQKRKEKAKQNKEDNTPERLAVKEEIQKSKLKRLTRSHEEFKNETESI